MKPHHVFCCISLDDISLSSKLRNRKRWKLPYSRPICSLWQQHDAYIPQHRAMKRNRRTAPRQIQKTSDYEERLKRLTTSSTSRTCNGGINWAYVARIVKSTAAIASAVRIDRLASRHTLNLSAIKGFLHVQAPY